MLLMLVMIWTSSVFQFWSTEQRVDLKYKTLVAVTLMSALCKPLLSIFFILHMEDKVTARILGLAVVELAFFSWMFFSQLIKGKKIYSKKYWRYAIGFCVPLIPHYLSQTVLSGADRIMIEKLVDTSSAGIYGLAYSLSQLMTIFNTALLSTINPWIYKKIKEKNIKEVVSLSYLVCIIIAFVNILLIAIAPEAVRVFAPSSYIDAIWIIPSVAMSVYFQFQYSIFSDFEFYYEKTSFIASATILSAGLNILLNFIFIRQFGYVAAGYTTLVCYIAYTCFHYATSKYIIKKEIQSSDTFDTRILLLISIIFVGVGFGLQITYSYTPIRYTILIIIFAVIFIKRKTIISVIKNEIMSKRNAD
jgi:O-antigen/teichoic acid export membrane protein